MDKPTGSPAVGAKQQIEKQARQLAYDTRYKVKQAMSAKSGGKMDPAAVRKAYMTQLGKSSAAPAVKARAKQMLLGEDLIDTRELANESMVSALYKVFVEGVQKEVEEVEQLDEMEDKKYKIRVTDKKTGNTYVRNASRSKIAELRANPNISSVEMTGYGSVSDDEKKKGSQTAAAKAGKDYDGDGKIESGAKEYRGAVHNAIQRKKGGKPDGQDTSSVKEGLIYEKEEKTDKDNSERKITGEGVNNKKIVKVYPTMKEEMKTSEKEEKKTVEISPEEKKQLDMKKKMLQKKLMMQRQTMQMQRQGKLPLNYSEECDVCDKCGKSPCECEVEDPRGMKTKINLMRNKMRSMGLKMSYEPKGDKINEEDYDRMKDRRMERGGVGANVDYNRPPAKKLSNAELGIKPGKTAVQKELEKKYGKGKSAMDIVRADIEAKHGKGAIK